MMRFWIDWLQRRHHLQIRRRRNIPSQAFASHKTLFSRYILNFSESDIYVYSTTIPDTLLAPGSYLLSIVNNTNGDADDDWFWATSSQMGNSRVRASDTSPWETAGLELAFNISGPAGVPDTGASALFLGLGFIAVLVFRRGLGGGEERRRLRVERGAHSPRRNPRVHTEASRLGASLKEPVKQRAGRESNDGQPK